MECTCEVSVLAWSRLDAISKEIAKLREAVADGRYDERSLVGDAVLRIEGQLSQLYEFFPAPKEASHDTVRT